MARRVDWMAGVGGESFVPSHMAVNRLDVRSPVVFPRFVIFVRVCFPLAPAPRDAVRLQVGTSKSFVPSHLDVNRFLRLEITGDAGSPVALVTAPVITPPTTNVIRRWVRAGRATPRCFEVRRVGLCRVSAPLRNSLATLSVDSMRGPGLRRRRQSETNGHNCA